MGQALGILDSGVLAQGESISRIDPNEPLALGIPDSGVSNS